MGHPAAPPLAGYRVAVTSARRSDELCTLLRRHGAAVSRAAAITMVALPDDDELHRNTEALIASPPDIVVATTGVGFRGWLAAADGWQLASQLTAALSGARVLARGAKVTGALRAAGLPEEWSPKTESSREVVQYLRQSGIAGCRIAVQLHGATDDWDPFPEFLDELRSAGAEVVPIRVYRWKPVPAGGDFDQLVTQIAQRHFDAVSFTSAPAVAATLMRAGDLGISDQLLNALRTDVRAMCIGPVTAQPLVRLGVPTSSPKRMRLAALARHIAEELPVLRSRTMQAAGHRIEIRGSYVMVDGHAPVAVPGGDGDSARIGAPSRRRGRPPGTATNTAGQRPTTLMPWIPRCCGYEKHWVTGTLSRRSSNAVTGWRSMKASTGL